jgi:hypothetical protein
MQLTLWPEITASAGLQAAYRMGGVILGGRIVQRWAAVARYNPALTGGITSSASLRSRRNRR